MLFISHSAKDKAEALDVQRRLLERGYDVAQLFLDSDAESGIPVGSKWEEVLYARLKDCRALILLCSANWKQSKWCFAELVYAKAMGKEIFPVLLESCDIGGVAGQHQGVLVYKEGEAAYARLWAALESRHLSPQDDFRWNPEERALTSELLNAVNSAVETARDWGSGFVGVPHLLVGLASIPDGLLSRFLQKHSIPPQTWKESLRKTIKQLPIEARLSDTSLEPTEGLTHVFASAREFVIPVMPELTERVVLRSIFSVRTEYIERIARTIGIPLVDLGNDLAPRVTPFADS
jgi:hypothetical protein